MRIAVISDVIYPWNKGGAEKRYFEIYRRLAKKHEVHYFTIQYPGMEKEFTFNRMQVHAISPGPPNLYTASRRKIGPAIKFTILLFFTLMKYRFDVIDSNEFPHLPNFTVKLYKLFHPRTIFLSTWHEHWGLYYWLKYLGLLGGFFGYILQVLSAQAPDHLIVVSKKTKEDLIDSKSKKPESITIVGNGIDYDDIKETITSFKPQKGVVTFVGRLIPEKRVGLLIEFFQYLRKHNSSIRLKIIGGGPELEYLRTLDISGSVEFTGYVKNHIDVLRHVVGASLFISMSEREGFNISALEACEMGVPTFVRLVCFVHPNLHELTRYSIADVIDSLNTPSSPNPVVREVYSWDNIAVNMEQLLITKSRTETCK